MDIVAIIVASTASLMALLGFGSFLAIKIMRISMKLSDDYENKAQIEEMKRAHAAEIEDLRGQVNRLSEAIIDGSLPVTPPAPDKKRKESSPAEGR